MASFFFNDTATTEIYTLSLHDALPISHDGPGGRVARRRRRRGHAAAGQRRAGGRRAPRRRGRHRSEEHTSELQSQSNLVCRLLLEIKKQIGGECEFADRMLAIFGCYIA